MKERALKVLYYFVALVTICLASFGILYKWGIPSIVNNSAPLIEKQAKDFLNANVSIVGMKLKTGLDIAFTIEKIYDR